MTIEILAPAGSPEAFLAACEAGANAVYAGVSAFNARQRAKNFGYRDLACMTEYAHKRKIKVYAAFNTLIKQNELRSVLKAAEAIADTGVDAFIIQDLGVYLLLKKYFPDMKLHASTQMAIHNSCGVNILKTLGFSRVVLARELSVKEIEEISAKTDMELEIFVHGALCFSLSGLCLLSGRIGGQSGNRGLCVQPCRRLWKHCGTERRFLSTCDLDASRFIQDFKRLKITSLKIEGRMKSCEYVARAVRRWRELADLGRSETDENFSRKKTDYYLAGEIGQIVNSGESPCVGLFAGKISKCSSDRAFIKVLSENLHSGDLVRFIRKNDEETDSLYVEDLTRDNSRVESAHKGESCSFKLFDAPLRENLDIYIAGRPLPFLKGLKNRLRKIYEAYGKNARLFGVKKRCLEKNLYSELKLRKTKFKNGTKGSAASLERTSALGNSHEPLLFLKLSSYFSTEIIKLFKPDFIIVRCSLDLTVKDLTKRLNGYPKNKVILAPDIFIPERSLYGFKILVNSFFASGFTRWHVDNLGHLGLMPPRAVLSAGHFLYSLNSLALNCLDSLKFTFAVASYEDDFLNMRYRSEFARMPSVYTVFSYSPVFYSRIASPHFLADGSDLSSDGFKVKIFNRGEYISGVSGKPLAIFQHMDKLAKISAFGFLIDLEYNLNAASLDDIYKAYLAKSPFKDSDKYNFKRELK